MSRYTTIYKSSGVIEYRRDGRPITKREFDKAMRSMRQRAETLAPSLPPRRRASAWPIISDAMAVHPKDVPAWREHYRKHGISPDTVQDDGRLRFENENHRRSVCHLDRYFDKKGGFSPKYR